MLIEVTYHPISKSDLKYFVLDVLEKPELTASRIRELTDDARAQQQLEDVYRATIGWAKQLRAGEKQRASETLAFPAVVILGFRHPFWHAAQSSISAIGAWPWSEMRAQMTEKNNPSVPLLDGALSNLQEIVVPLPSIGSGLAAMYDDPNGGLIDRELGASGIFPKDKLPALVNCAEEFFLCDIGFNSYGFGALNKAVDYAIDHGLDLMEAYNVVSLEPYSCQSAPKNLRFPDGEPGGDESQGPA